MSVDILLWYCSWVHVTAVVGTKQQTANEEDERKFPLTLLHTFPVKQH